MYLNRIRISNTVQFSHDGGSDSDIIRWLSKARNALQRLNNVWKSAQYSTTTELRLYQSCVLSTLSTICQPFTPKAYRTEQYPTNIFSACVNRKTWLPSLWKGDGNGLGMSHLVSRTSPELPFAGHRKVNPKEADPRTCGAGQWKESWRPYMTPAVP